MPIYEFFCNSCGQMFERFVVSSERASDIMCPKCGSGEVKKVVSSFACGCGSPRPSAPSRDSSCESGGFSRRFG